MARVLGRIRLSRVTDESTSAVRQREIITGWAKSNDHEIVGWAEDLDVSGSVDPFQAPALGRWLERPDDWDILCAWKLDRLGRRAIQLNKLFGWTLENRKTLVCVSDNIDLSTWVGRLVASVIAGVAEGELEAISERNRASRRKLLESGRWTGGGVPYGLTPVPAESGGWTLDIDQEQAAVIRRMVSEVVAGSSIEAVSEHCGKHPSTAWAMLRSRHLIGHATYGRRTVRDRDGNPVLSSPPILSIAEWDRLQSALDSRSKNGGRTRATSPMNGVVTCYVCGQNLFHKTYRRNGNVYRYYHCRDSTHSAMVRAEDVEGILEDAFLTALADKPVKERVFVAGQSHADELEQAERAVDELSDLLGTMTSDRMRQRLTEQLTALDRRIAELEQLPDQPSGWVLKDTGITFNSEWENSDQDERRRLLLRSGITFAVRRTPKTNKLEYRLYTPDDAEVKLTDQFNFR